MSPPSRRLCRIFMDVPHQRHAVRAFHAGFICGSVCGSVCHLFSSPRLIFSFHPAVWFLKPGGCQRRSKQCASKVCVCVSAPAPPLSLRRTPLRSSAATVRFNDTSPSAACYGNARSINPCQHRLDVLARCLEGTKTFLAKTNLISQDFFFFFGHANDNFSLGRWERLQNWIFTSQTSFERFFFAQQGAIKTRKKISTLMLIVDV